MVETSKHNKIPTIKGIFVNSHINFLKKNGGKDALEKLEKKMQKSIKFSTWQDVPLSEEIQIIEYVFDIVYPSPGLSSEVRAFEAGRLHFRNFITTPFGKILFTALPKNFKATVLKLPMVIKHIFRNLDFSVTGLSNNKVKIEVSNMNYPPEHFTGLFHEWMLFWKLKGKIDTNIKSNISCEYLIAW
jgi:uncharacterized protein (TIGR02265 family)